MRQEPDSFLQMELRRLASTSPELGSVRTVRYVTRATSSDKKSQRKSSMSGGKNAVSRDNNSMMLLRVQARPEEPNSMKFSASIDRSLFLSRRTSVSSSDSSSSRNSAAVASTSSLDL